MSTHRVEVVKLGPIEKHPNADKIELVQIWGYTAAIRIGEFKEGDLAIFVEPDFIVPETEQFAFLTDRRIRAKRLRGIWSQGLVIKAPEGAQEGDNVMEALGIVRYDPRVRMTGHKGASIPYSGAEAAPALISSVPKYDLENLRKYHKVLEEGEEVYVTEKLHGTNAKFSYSEGRFWCGSRSFWRKETEDCFYWNTLKRNGWIQAVCQSNPDAVIFGEIYGDIQDLKYGHNPEDYSFRAFDVFANGRFLDADEFYELFSTYAHPELMTAPLKYKGPFNKEKVVELSLENSTLANHISEGVVVKPVKERYDRSVGRVALKLVSDKYLERAK